MRPNFGLWIRVSLYVALVLSFSQSVVLAQDKAARIQEVLALAHKYRQFNGTALVAQNGKVMTFMKDAGGKVTALRLNQNGREREGKKIR